MNIQTQDQSASQNEPIRLNWNRVQRYGARYASLALGVVVLYLLAATSFNLGWHFDLPTLHPGFLMVIAVLVTVILSAESHEVWQARGYSRLMKALSEAVALSAPPSQILGHFLAPLADYLEVRAASAFLYDPGTTSYLAVQAIGFQAHAVGSARFGLTDQVARWLHLTSPFLKPSGYPDRDYPAQISKEEMAGLKALNIALIVAIRLRGNLMGWLAFSKSEAGSDGLEANRELLLSLCDQLAVAIENAQLQTRAERREQEIGALIEIAKATASTLDLNTLLHFLTAKVGELLDADGVLLYFPEADAELTLQAVWDAAGLDRAEIERLPFGKGIAGTVAASGRPLVTREIGSDPHFLEESEAFQGWGLQSIVAVPLKTRDHVVGVLVGVARRKGRLFDDGDLRLLAFLSDYAAIAIENARLHADLKRDG